MTNKKNKVGQILEGRAEDLDIDVLECVEWIESLKKKVVEETELEVDIEAFRQYIRKVKESKSSSPSGRHYGHYKVLEKDDELIGLVYDIM